jgi:hypothetical protein
MVWKELRERLIFMVMSAFVVWHTIAIMIAPGSDNSLLVQQLRRVYEPYLSLFRLNNKWDFYAPNVGRGHQLRYVVEGADGARETITPTDEWHWHHPGYWWFRAWNDAIIASPDLYADKVIATLCRKHAASKPAAITLTLIQELAFAPEDHLAGRHPLDPEFVEESTLRRGPCPSS